MRNITAYVAGNLAKRTVSLLTVLTSPKVIKNILFFSLIILVGSQLFIFYVFIAARVNTADSWIAAFKALNCSDCGYFVLWEMLINALGLFFLQFQTAIFALSIFLLICGGIIIRIIPEYCYRIRLLPAAIFLLSAPAIIAGLAAFEVLPYLINNYM